MSLRAGLLTATLLLAAVPVGAAQPQPQSTHGSPPATSGTAGKGKITRTVVPAHPATPGAALIRRPPSRVQPNGTAAATGHGAKPATVPSAVATMAHPPAGLATLLSKLSKPRIANGTRGPRIAARLAVPRSPLPANTLGGPLSRRSATVGAVHGPLPGRLGGPQHYDTRTAGGLTGTGWHRRL